MIKEAEKARRMWVELTSYYPEGRTEERRLVQRQIKGEPKPRLDDPLTLHAIASRIEADEEQ